MDSELRLKLGLFGAIVGAANCVLAVPAIIFLPAMLSLFAAAYAPE